MNGNEEGKSVFGNHLRTIRKQKGLTLVQLQENSGVSNSYLSQLENNQFTPSNEVLKKLSEGLGVPMGTLMMAAGYIDDPFDHSMNEGSHKARITLSVPRHIDIMDDDDGVITTLAVTPEHIFDLHYAFYLGFKIHYKNKELTDEEIEKVKVMLKTILE